MKRFGIIYSCIFVALLFYGVDNVSAQVQVTRGSIHHYSVSPLPDTATYNYNWSVTPGGTSSTFGTTATTNDVEWNGLTGIYTITVYPTKPLGGCTGNNHTLLISVVDMNIVWFSTSSIQCPMTDNQTGDFTLTVEYTGVTGEWSFKYIIDGMAEQTVNVAAGNSATINFNGFTNASTTAPEIHTIHITSVTTYDNHTVNYTGTEPDAATRLHTVTVTPTPNTSGIIQL